MSEDRDNLTGLFHRYRAACPELEASGDFMPRLWRRIDARRGFAQKLRAYAHRLVTVAATLCLAAFVFELSPLSGVNNFYTHTYVDILDEEDAPEQLAFSDIVQTGHPVLLNTTFEPDNSGSPNE
jgi:hypothetical protein